jgi:hypothetical protein
MEATMKFVKGTACRRLAGLLSILGALALATPAHAQFGGQQQQPYGGTVGVPLWSLGQVLSLNLVRQRNVNVVAIQGLSSGNYNSMVAVVGVTQRNSFGQYSPAKSLFVPASAVSQVRQINLNRVEINQVAVGNGNTQVAEVSVDQSNQAAFAPKGSLRTFFVPMSALGQVIQLNANLVFITQVAIGDGNTQVALVGVSQQNASQVKIPVQHQSSILQLNMNITVINQVAVGDGNTQVAVVNVDQSNQR